VRRAVENEARESIAALHLSALLYCVLKLRSHTASNARPCAKLARRATVHGVLASKSLSKVSAFSGCRYPASTYGSAVLASVERERRKKMANEGSCEADGGEGLWCARYDSNPLLKAKDPSGSAESERRRRAWSAACFIRCRAPDDRMVAAHLCRSQAWMVRQRDY
jgi:hypothetical protein